ncbi:hypothetical protein [Paenibacillus amylolyticus]|uniref:hypothetical protein n=1 Tax=Paenibacillus amylolyticus TaxID=1451 RepID=UPI00158A7C7B|nr:hypothetical protein [Paenibacillus amylolyticus]
MQHVIDTAELYDVSGYLEPGLHILFVIEDNSSGVMGWRSIRYSHMATDQTQNELERSPWGHP